MLTLALPKGRLLDPALALLSGMGIRSIEPDSRRLLVADEAECVEGVDRIIAFARRA